MRDDIHNKAPLSQACRALLRRCLREADRQDATRLIACAAKALDQEITRAIPEDRLQRLCESADERLMFPDRALSTRPRSRMEADFVNCLNRDAPAPNMALQTACLPHISRLAREAEAALIAAEPHSAPQISVGVRAFQSALAAAAADVATAKIEGSRQCAAPAPITADTRLSLGPRAGAKKP